MNRSVPVYIPPVFGHVGSTPITARRNIDIIENTIDRVLRRKGCTNIGTNSTTWRSVYVSRWINDLAQIYYTTRKENTYDIPISD